MKGPTPHHTHSATCVDVHVYEHVPTTHGTVHDVEQLLHNHGGALVTQQSGHACKVLWSHKLLVSAEHRLISLPQGLRGGGAEGEGQRGRGRGEGEGTVKIVNGCSLVRCYKNSCKRTHSSGAHTQSGRQR